MAEIREEYQRRADLDFKATSEMAARLLPKLFDDGQYTEEEKSLFLFCRNVVENFIYREVLNLKTPIAMKFERVKPLEEKLDPIREEFLIRLALTYVLHSQHNRRLNRCDEKLYSLKIKDDYLIARILSVARKSPGYSERKKIISETEATILTDEIFNIATKISITYVSPNTNLKRIWEAPKYNSIEGFKITISIDTVRDKEIANYAEYIKYLLTEERNTVGNFTSTALWRNATHSRFSKDASLENFAANDIQLILFCLALGLDIEVFNRLVKLRNEAFNGEETSIKQPALTENEKIILLEYLKQSEERLRCARNEAYVYNKNDIVRRVLVNVSVDLIKSGLLPVVVLTDEEVERTNIDKKFLEKAYDTGKNGERIFKKMLSSFAV